MSDKKVLVVYYSRTGTTKKVAEALALKYKADMEEIVDTKSRSGLLGYILSGRDAIKGASTTIKPMKYNPADYDLVIIGSPVWASRVIPPIRTYIDQNKKTLKNVAFFITQAGSGADKVSASMTEVSGLKPEFTLEFSRKDMKNHTFTEKINNL